MTEGRRRWWLSGVFRSEGAVCGVVGVEANPHLAKKAEHRFAGAIAEGRLMIEAIAVASYAGEIDFFINNEHDDWGTTSPKFASRKEKMGTANQVVKVPSQTFDSILRKHGIPYYLKIDIEGADLLCLQALSGAKANERPRFVSIEAGLNSFDETFSELSLLWQLGYWNSKIVNQIRNHQIACPNPPLEGVYTQHSFDGMSSGPFGEEAPGEWMSAEKTFLHFRRILREQKYFGAGGSLFRTPIHRLYNKIINPVGWYDIHARHVAA